MKRKITRLYTILGIIASAVILIVGIIVGAYSQSWSVFFMFFAISLAILFSLAISYVVLIGICETTEELQLINKRLSAFENRKEKPIFKMNPVITQSPAANNEDINFGLFSKNILHEGKYHTLYKVFENVELIGSRLPEKTIINNHSFAKIKISEDNTVSIIQGFQYLLGCVFDKSISDSILDYVKMNHPTIVRITNVEPLLVTIAIYSPND